MAERDLEQTFHLLWRTQKEPTRGPKPKLTLDEIVAAAVEIADAEGLDGLSMRQLAERFDVSTMALYRYLPGKEDLIDLMVDVIAYPPPDPDDVPDDWREALSWWAGMQMDAFVAHPWLNSYAFSTPPMGPNNVAWMECALAAILRAGIPAGESVAVLMILTNYTISTARLQIFLHQAEQSTGLSYDEVGPVYARVLGNVVSSGRYPALTAAIESAAFGDPGGVGSGGADDDYQYGLKFILDGIEAMAERWADTP